MANEYAVNSADLTAVADAIREKGGTSDVLAFPDGFVEAVEAIRAGSGNDSDIIKSLVDCSITSLALPDGLEYIRPFAFYSCNKLESVSLPQSVKSIGDHAFYECKSVTFESDSLPSGITSIADYTFHGNSKLVLTSLPDGITSIGQYAFYYCSGLALTSLPDGITSIGVRAFCGCPLQISKFPSGIKRIEQRSFENCSCIKTLEIHAGVTCIDVWAFASCANLEKVTFRGTPSAINGVYVFHNDPKLTTINVPWAEGEVAGAPWGAANATINYNYTGEEE